MQNNLKKNNIELENKQLKIEVGLLNDAYFQYKKYVKMLKVFEDKYKILFDNSKDLIIIINTKTGIITDLNPIVCELLEYKVDELIGKPIYEIDSFKSIFENSNKLLEIVNMKSIRYSEISISTKSGEIKYIDLIANSYNYHEDSLMQISIRDISGKVELDIAKNEFLTIASHQLRTPLSICKWLLESLLSDNTLTNKQLEKLLNLQDANERIIHLVNDLLNVSTIETGKLVVNKRFVDIRQLLDEIIRAEKTLFSKKYKIVKISIDADIKYISCDSILMKESLGNLINNAVYYSTEGPNDINVAIINRKDDYLISVHNDGVIDSETQNRLKSFSKFIRGNEAKKIEPAGSGLGLYISRKMVEANGGSIWFESESNIGTTFYITIKK